MLDHLSVPVTDIDRSRQFYESALAPLGYRLIKDFNHAISFGVLEGYGKSSDPGGEFWIYQGKALPCPATHFAFSAETRDVVDAFYHAAIAAGGQDNGKPGIRDLYHAHYYAAFVRDPDGYNIEAVFHRSIAP
ncbi:MULTISPECIES: VOC family protein [unclassified Symbiopectobacterium]|uniref:VOC family protein n=1 Tax=unclassified Symbiopectobacterium TaxID=2794573 RepID=UPI0022263D03|nr:MULTISPECIES: VOC family protein [unclassified Symbiopectobacterium]MCW2475670.1 VOC family protein [Candidatus Symbiopectobacterium sp. NZEC151]MCW2486147.1 VOC family protein [Candidatus Symbiopectobacterium sp. NZEC127]